MYDARRVSFEFGVPTQYKNLLPGYYFTTPGTKDLYYKGHPDNPVSKSIEGNYCLMKPCGIFKPNAEIIPIETGTGIAPEVWAETNIWTAGVKFVEASHA